MPVYQWVPNDPLEPGSLWELIFDKGAPAGQRYRIGRDGDLRGAVEALRRAGAGTDDVDWQTTQH